jgi:hypothetical protein
MDGTAGLPPLFFEFSSRPPEAADCLARLHKVFGCYETGEAWCRQCFSPEEEARLRAAAPKRAELAGFSAIYFESCACSGGEETFKRWLPRGLELGRFEIFCYASVMDRAWSLLPWRWPEAEQAALRETFARALINLIDTGEATPLKGGEQAPDWSCEILIVDLLRARIEPFELFDWLARRDEPIIWQALASLTKAPRLVGELACAPIYGDEERARLDEGLAALERRAEAALAAALTPERLDAAHARWTQEAPGLANMIWELSLAAANLSSEQSAQEREADEAALRRAVGAPIV